MCRGERRPTLEDAVAAASAAFPAWRRTPAPERATLLHDVAFKIQAHFDELAHLLTREEGKPLPENEEELEWTLNSFHYYAELGRHERGQVIPPGDPGQFNFVLKEPYGVVAAIVPWNYPLLLLAWKLAPALAAGNTVVVKPSELTPLTTLRLVELACDHLPPGVVNVVTGYGPEVGEPLARHPDVRVIAFTGSVATGQRLASIGAPVMKKLHLELGGKDPMVIGPDVDLQVAAQGLAYAALINAGQVCTSTERRLRGPGPLRPIRRRTGGRGQRPAPGSRTRPWHRRRPHDPRPFSAQGRGAPRRRRGPRGAGAGGWPPARGIRARLLLRAHRADRRRPLDANHAGRDLRPRHPPHALP